ncbi:MAG: hypothetical protein IJ614_05525 [Prevotella sp.]|nr:hypothetical protein [Prevotella sp.]
MMKKKMYTSPDMEVIMISASQQLMSGSVTVEIDSAEDMPTGEFGAPSLNDLIGIDLPGMSNIPLN